MKNGLARHAKSYWSPVTGRRAERRQPGVLPRAAVRIVLLVAIAAGWSFGCRSARNPEVARSLLQEGSGYFNALQYRKAVEVADSIIAADSQNADAYYLRGRALYLHYVQAYYKGDTSVNREDLSRALKDFSRVIELKPSFSAAHDYRGMIYTAEGKYELALKEFNTALRIQPMQAETYYGRAELFERQGRYHEAIADYRRFMQISRDEYWRNKARRKIRELEEAVAAST